MYKRCLLYFFAILLAFAASAQNKLLIGKPGRPAKYAFFEGEQIRFKLNGEKFWNKAFIQGLGEDKIRLHYASIALEEIAVVDIRDRRRGRLIQTLASVGVIGGAGFAAIDQLNRTLVRHEPGVDKKSMLIGGALLSAGGIFMLLKKRRVKIGKVYMIKIHK